MVQFRDGDHAREAKSQGDNSPFSLIRLHCTSDDTRTAATLLGGEPGDTTPVDISERHKIWDWLEHPLPPMLFRVITELSTWQKPGHEFGHDNETNKHYLERLRLTLDVAQIVYPDARKIWTDHHVIFKAGQPPSDDHDRIRIEKTKEGFSCIIMGINWHTQEPLISVLRIIERTAEMAHTHLMRAPTNREIILSSITVDETYRRLFPRLIYAPYDHECNVVGSFFTRTVREHLLKAMLSQSIPGNMLLSEIRARAEEVRNDAIELVLEQLEKDNAYLDTFPGRTYVEQEMMSRMNIRPIKANPNSSKFQEMMSHSRGHVIWGTTTKLTDEGVSYSGDPPERELWVLPRWNQEIQEPYNHSMLARWIASQGGWISLTAGGEALIEFNESTQCYDRVTDINRRTGHYLARAYCVMIGANEFRRSGFDVSEEAIDPHTIQGKNILASSF